MLGYNSPEEAKAAYMENYDKDWQGFSAITEVPIEDFKKWAYDGKRQSKPFNEYKETPQPTELQLSSSEKPNNQSETKERAKKAWNEIKSKNSEAKSLNNLESELKAKEIEYKSLQNKYDRLVSEARNDPFYGFRGQMDIFGNTAGEDNLFKDDVSFNEGVAEEIKKAKQNLEIAEIELNKARQLYNEVAESEKLRQLDLGIGEDAKLQVSNEPINTSSEAVKYLSEKFDKIGIEVVTDEKEIEKELGGQFSIIGEQGAEALDKAEEATTRMDN